MFDREKAKMFRSDLLHALADLERTYGCKFDIGSIKFSDMTIQTTIKGIEEGFVEKMISLKASPVKIGDKFLVPSKGVLVVTGYNPRAKQYKIQAELNGRKVKLSAEHLATLSRIK